MSPYAAARAALPVLDGTAHPLPRARWTRRAGMVVLYPGADGVVLRPGGLGDAREIHSLQDGFARRGLLLRRTLDQVCRTVKDYTVAVEDGRIVGCGSLRIYSETLAEIGGLAVAEDRHGRGIGARVVASLREEAEAIGIRTLFALTMQDGFFHRLGFRTVDVREFPEKVVRDCASCDRRSACIEVAVACELDRGDEGRRA